MPRHPAFALVALLALPAWGTGCSSAPAPSPAPPPVADYRAPGPAPGVAPAPYARAPLAPAPAAGPFRWHTRIAEAQAEARATGRMILAASTKDNCGLCEKFRHQVVPALAPEVAAAAVGYVYDITAPESAQVNSVVRANLRGASLMPLVGLLTCELRWVHGFWGATSANEFRAVLAEATRRHPVRVARGPAGPAGATLGALTTPVVNEYGELEWSPLADVWPNAATTPRDTLPDAPRLAGAGSASEAAPAAPDPAPALAPAPAPRPGPVPAPAPTLAAAPSTPPAAPVAQPTSPPAEPWSLPAAAPAAAPAPAPAPTAGGTAAPGWAERMLREALEAIRAGRYDAARALLSEVQARAPDSPAARDAAKGSVAIYNLKRIEQAGDESARRQALERARRDLGASFWGDLFA